MLSQISPFILIYKESSESNCKNLFALIYYNCIYLGNTAVQWLDTAAL